MTYALLAKVNEAEDACARGSFSEAVLIQMQVIESQAIGSKFAAEIIDDILRDAMRERACYGEARPQ
jgi:hypothetical protein